MINYKELDELMDVIDFKYFAFISDNRKIYSSINGNKKNTGFYVINQLAGKISLEEYTSEKYKKVSEGKGITVESAVKTDKFRYIRQAVLNKVDESILEYLDSAVLYVFIDSGNTFSGIYAYLDKIKSPYIAVKYSGKMEVDRKMFSGINALYEYLVEKYYL